MKRAIFTALLALSAVDEKYGVTETITEFRDRVGHALNPSFEVPEGLVLVPTHLTDAKAKQLAGNTGASIKLVKDSYRQLINDVAEA